MVEYPNLAEDMDVYEGLHPSYENACKLYTQYQRTHPSQPITMIAHIKDDTLPEKTYKLILNKSTSNSYILFYFELHDEASVAQYTEKQLEGYRILVDKPSIEAFTIHLNPQLSTVDPTSESCMFHFENHTHNNVFQIRCPAKSDNNCYNAMLDVYRELYVKPHR